MHHSQSYVITLTCKQCMQEFQYEIWKIVDIQGKPELLEKIKTGSIRAYKCPHCENEGILDAPLLIFQPRKPPHLIFVPSRQANQKQNQAIAMQMLKDLKVTAGEVELGNYIKFGLPSFPLFLVTIALETGAEATYDLLNQIKKPNHELDEIELDSVSHIAKQAAQEFQLTRIQSALELAISAWEKILKSSTFQNTETEFQLDVMGNIGGALLFKHLTEGQIEDLDQGMKWTREALNLTPEDSPYNARFLSNLGSMFSARYQIFNHQADLEQGIESCQKAVNLPFIESQDKLMVYRNLGNLLSIRYHTYGDLSDLKKTIKATLQVFDLAPPDSPDKATLLKNLGSMLADYYKKNNDPSYLEKTIHITQQVVDRTPESSPNKADLLFNLGKLLFERFLLLSHIHDLNKAIQVTRKSVDLISNNNQKKARILTNLGLMLSNLYTLSNDEADLNTSIQISKQAVDLTPNNSPEKWIFLTNLGKVFQIRYHHFGDSSALENAINATQESANLVRQDSPDKATILTNLGIMFFDRYKLKGTTADIVNAIKISQHAIDLVADEHPNRAGILSNHSILLAERYLASGHLDDLDNAIHFTKHAVDLSPNNSSNLAISLNNLGLWMADRYKHSGNCVDIEQAIQMSKKSVNLTSKGSLQKAIHINNLSKHLIALYKHSGDLTDLDEALKALQNIINQIPIDSPAKIRCLTTLGSALVEKYKLTGDLAIMDKALHVTQEAINLSPTNSPDKAIFLHNLGVILSDRYEHTGDRDDLEKAIDVTQNAIDLTPSNSPDMSKSLNSLGRNLFEKYLYSGHTVDLENAIRVTHQAVYSTPSNSLDRIEPLSNLSIMLSNRFDRYSKLEDLELAVEMARLSVDLIPQGSPRTPMHLTNLSNALTIRFNNLGEEEDLAEGQYIYKKILKLAKEVHPEALIKASVGWGNWALERESWEEAIEAFCPGLMTIDTLVRQHAIRASKEVWLKEAQGVPARYAYALARNGNLKQALETIEAGRGRLLSEKLSLGNIDLQALKDHAPKLVRRYQELTAQAFKWQSNELQQNEDIETVRHELRSINQKLEQLAEQIRQVDGFEHFLAPVRLMDIYQATQEYPIAYIAATPAGGMALLALPKGRAKTLWFDELTHDRLLEQIQGPKHAPELGGYLGAYQDWKISLDPNRKLTRAEKELSFKGWLRALDDTTQWLWDIVMGELTNWLSEQGYTHCTLVPTGLLTLVPLHAAWREDEITPKRRHYALDEIDYSYAPNALALLGCQKKVNRPTDDILLIENPNPGKKEHNIPFSESIGEAALEHFNKAESIHFQGNVAKMSDVLEALPSASTVFFWTHGLSNPQHPLESSLLMANEEELTLRDILPLDLPKARLAILSACETGMVGLRNIDEVVSLPTGLIQAGVPGVIGSMWSVETISTLMLMLKFFDLWKAGQGLPPQEAFRQAQQWLRDTTNKEKETYFETLKQKPEQGSSLLMPDISAEAAYLEMMLKNPNERSFSHPFFWAAFGYHGV